MTVEVRCGACGTTWQAVVDDGTLPTECPFCGDDDERVQPVDEAAVYAVLARLAEERA